MTNEGANKVNKTGRKILAITLYVFAGVYTIYACWTVPKIASYIGELLAAGQIAFPDQTYDVFNIIMSNVMSPFFSALVLASLGMLVQNLKITPRVVVEAEHELEAAKAKVAKAEKKVQKAAKKTEVQDKKDLKNENKK